MRKITTHQQHHHTTTTMGLFTFPPNLTSHWPWNQHKTVIHTTHTTFLTFIKIPKLVTNMTSNLLAPTLSAYTRLARTLSLCKLSTGFGHWITEQCRCVVILMIGNVICPSGVRALPLAAAINEGGHYFRYFGPSGVRALPLADCTNEGGHYFR